MRKNIILFLLLTTPSFALITSMDMHGLLHPSGKLEMIIKANVSDSAGKLFYLNLTGHPDQVVVRDGSGLIINHNISIIGSNTIISTTVPADYLNFNIISDSFTTKNRSKWSFDLGVGASQDIHSFSASLELPNGATLKSTNGAVESSGDSLVVLWKADNVPLGSRARLRAGYTLSDAESWIDYLPLMAGVVLLLFFIGILIWVRNRQKISENKTTPLQQQQTTPKPLLEENKVFVTLNETDKEIVREIMSRGKKTTQAQLYLNTHIPKATLSRRLSSLENRGIIRRTKKGNRKLISLTDVLER